MAARLANLQRSGVVVLFYFYLLYKSRHHEDPNESSPETHEYYRTLRHQIIEEVPSKCPPLCRETQASRKKIDSHESVYSQKQQRSDVQLSERLASLGIRGTQLRAPLKPPVHHCTIVGRNWKYSFLSVLS